MFFYLSFAFKNLGRHKKRTFITALAIAVGLSAYLFIDSMLQGADKASERNLLWYETGSLRVYSPKGAGEWQKLSLKNPLDKSAEALALLEQAGYATAPRLSFQAELVLNDARYESPTSLIVRAIAIDPLRDSKVFPQNEMDLEGRWFGPEEEGLVLGRWLAEDLGVKVGDPVSVSARTREGSFQVLDLEVTGILDGPNPNMNRSGVFLPLRVADAQLEMRGAATELVIGLEIGSPVEAEAQKVKSLLGQAGFDVEVLTWKDLAADYLAISGAKQKGTSMILFLVFVIAAVGISNTLLMAFYERKNEIGMLRALGMDDRTLFWTFIAEAAGIGLLGSVLGLVLGAAAVAFLVYVGIDFGFIIRSMDIGYRISGLFRGVWNPPSFVQALFFGILLAALTAVLPTRRALRLPITESLRVE